MTDPALPVILGRPFSGSCPHVSGVGSDYYAAVHAAMKGQPLFVDLENPYDADWTERLGIEP